ncbi:Crp/Fnr family transcriptional regulator [Hymenobacter sp. ASUV-10]|uniref:Crp/Fnr family transcriptional regulator n=1 Tax=Hymenobacter aranciens TaxID=3063996 RepID=A0ABT9BE93_9BACT|nr:Crp/Fnr family transcriptional regulator [Hymenobacter sp. ASUV-10]MDO7875978.1 Crp/Fnr family transcriptional regulator [Hymenobacter sp. ASUV-10]
MADRAQLIQFLQTGGRITQPQAEEIAQEFTAKTIGKNEFLLRAGQVSDDYVFLDQGFLRAFAYDIDGQDITTGFYGPGQVALEVASFFQRTPSLEYLQALNECQGWRISFTQLNELFHSRNDFRDFGRSVLVRGFAALKNRMLATITEPAAVRYEQLLRSQPALFQHTPLKYVASYLGITDTSLSRIRKGGGKR